ncbi:hypothetical protein DCM91_00495 [Chitinophaga costaii]|nr:hypothetical protein DCM91_00495 [Chitinophaga costaii]
MCNKIFPKVLNSPWVLSMPTADVVPSLAMTGIKGCMHHGQWQALMACQDKCTTCFHNKKSMGGYFYSVTPMAIRRSGIPLLETLSPSRVRLRKQGMDGLPANFHQ